MLSLWQEKAQAEADAQEPPPPEPPQVMECVWTSSLGADHGVLLFDVISSVRGRVHCHGRCAVAAFYCGGSVGSACGGSITWSVSGVQVGRQGLQQGRDAE